MNCPNCKKHINVIQLNSEIVSIRRRSTAWSREEDEMVRFTANLPLAEAAESLGRTPEAVKKRRQYLKKNTPDYEEKDTTPKCPDCGFKLDRRQVIQEASRERGRIMTEKRLSRIREMIENRTRL